MKIAIVQADLVWQDIASNLRNFQNRLEKIHDDVDVIVLPEMFSTGFSMDAEHLAETMEGPTIAWMSQIAKQKSANVIGSIIICENDSFYNRLISSFPNGELQFYDKKHLFSYAGEHEHFSSGKKQLNYRWKEFNIQPLICYDLRFPEWARNSGNTDILVYVASWPEKRAEHWSQLLRARAIENQCYVLACNRVGVDGNDFAYSGLSAVIDYAGVELISSKYLETTLYAELDLEGLQEYRKRFPFLKDQD